MSESKRLSTDSKRPKRKPSKRSTTEGGSTDFDDESSQVEEVLGPERSSESSGDCAGAVENSPRVGDLPPSVAAPETAAKNETMSPLQPKHGSANRVTHSSDPAHGKNVRVELADEYTIQMYFDKNSKNFVATVVEVPEVKVNGSNREEVYEEIHHNLADHLEILRRRGERMPETLNARRYPDKLELHLSQGLYRKLDILSRQERVGLEQLIAELLSMAIERRGDPGRGQDRRPAPQPSQATGNQRHSHHRRQGGHRSYHETMDNRENFMEYVRNLEKGHWRKK